MSLGDARSDFIELSKEYLNQFRQSSGSDFYGVGFFCDAYSGDVLVVANSEDYHREAFGRHSGTSSEDRFRWEIGNWNYPAGLFPSSSAEQRAFEEKWAKIKKRLG